MTTLKKISESGAYKDLPMPFYHGDCCDGPSVSSTTLRTVEEHSLRKAWMASHLNKDPKKKPSDAFRIGAALHSLAFEGGLSEKWFAVSPHDKFLTGEAKAWRDRQINAGKTILKKEELPPLKEMMEALVEDPDVRVLFDERGELETSVFHRDEETGLWLKVRPDVVPVNTILTDLKSTADVSPHAVTRAVTDYHYHMQLALAGEVIEKVIGVAIETYALVLIEKDPPYSVAVAEIDPDAIAWGKVLNRAAMRRYAECLAKGPEAKNFPRNRTTGIMTIRLPDWKVAQLTRRQEAGDLPSFYDVGYMAPH